MTPPSELVQVLRATGFMIGDIPAPGLMLDSPVLHDRIDLRPDAIWCDRSQLKVVFKCVPDEPPRTQIASWHRDVWNLGLTPLLWIVSPQRIRLYNAYERPKSTEDAGAHLLWQARMVDEELSRLDEYAGRLAMTSGSFWSNEDRIERGGRVDAQLLCDLQEVENQLCSAGLPREVAQGLLGRSIFVRYLADREIRGIGHIERTRLPRLEDGAPRARASLSPVRLGKVYIQRGPVSGYCCRAQCRNRYTPQPRERDLGRRASRYRPAFSLGVSIRYHSDRALSVPFMNSLRTGLKIRTRTRKAFITHRFPLSISFSTRL